MENIVAFGKLLADPTRLRIIKLLLTQPLCVCELMEILKLNQSCISQHLAILRYHRLIISRRDGKWIVYEVDRKTLDECINQTKQFFEMPLVKMALLCKECRTLATLKSRGLLCKRLKINCK